MNTTTLIFIFISSFLAHTFDHVQGELHESKWDFPTPFEKMEESYAAGNWELCIEYGMQAVANFKSYIGATIDCRKSCKLNERSLHVGKDDFLSRYSSSLEEITCIQKCRPRVLSADLYSQRMLLREPYDYIQLCYYKVSIYGSPK